MSVMLWTLQKGLSITSSQWLYLITKKKNQIGRNKYSFERERERATYWSYCQSFILSIYDKQGKLAFKSRYKVLF